MKKLFTNLKVAMTLLLLCGVCSAWGADVTYSFTPDKATTENSATAYVTSAYSFTYNEIEWSINQWNPSTLQIKTNQSSAGSEFNFKNTTAFPGRIKSVVIKFSALTVSNANGLCFVGGSSAISSLSGGTAGTWNSTAKTLTWTPASDANYTYFAFYQNGKAASGTNKLAEKDAITVIYESSKELNSVTISGTPSKTIYDAGEDFDPTGLTVTGTYSEGDPEVITSGITWDVTPSGPLTAGTTSVSVTATVGDITSEPYVVNNLTVTEFVQTYANTYTSDASLSSLITGSKVKWEGCKETDGYNALKIGKAGTANISVPAGTKTVHLHMVAWNGESYAVTVKLGSTTLPSINPTADAGVSGSSTTYTIAKEPNTEESYYFAIDVNAAEATTLSLTTGSDKRAILFGVNFEEGNFPTITADVEAIEFEEKELRGTPTDSKTIAATGKNLTAAISASMKDDSDAIFTVTPVETPSTTAGNFTVSYSATEVGEYSGIVVLSSEGATYIEIPVSVNIVDPIPVLQSIAVSGIPSKTEYVEGEKFDPTGLVVTGTYDIGDSKEITEGISWSVNPETLSLGTTSVDVTATVEGKTSVAYTVNGLTVNKLVKTWANTYTSNITLPSTDGCKVNIDGEQYDGIKAGTGKAAGFMTITVPANTKTLHMHLAGWGTETVKVSIDGDVHDILSDTGVSGNSPFTIAGNAEDYYLAVEIADNTEHDIVIKAVSGNRFVLFGVNAEKPVVITEEAGWATAYVPFNATVSDNVTAYYVTGTSGETLVKKPVTVIKAGEGVLLKSNNGEATTVTFTASTETADDASENLMKGSLTEKTFNDADTKYYILANGEEGLGFYYQGKDNTTGASATCAAGKAVLAIPTGSSAKAFFSLFDDATGIKEINNAEKQDAQYNLNGVRVNGNYKGIVIINGKKVVK